jgi:hypothetical protein
MGRIAAKDSPSKSQLGPIPDAASRELIARRYLGASEREEYRSHAPRG